MSRQAAATHAHKSKTLDNKYMLGDEIGKGAYGRVFKGLDLANGDFVAIKQVSLENILTEDLSTIMLEIDLLKNLNHKNIVKYLGSLKTETHLHIILEYVENGSLADIIKPNKFGPFPESLVAVYIAQVLEGLVYLHEQGVIHRDIKGANILTTKEGLVKLADFGVATTLTGADVETHSVVGTPYWMAPEVIDMSGVSAASDIWSVGCTVIELLTCVPPYFDLQPMAAFYHIVQDVLPPIPDGLSPEITDFLHQCFKKDARQRPDAKTLLMHPWIHNSRKALPSSLRQNGSSIRNINDDNTVHDHNLVENAQYGSQCLEGNKNGTAVLDAEQGKAFEVTDSSQFTVDHDFILVQNTCTNSIDKNTQNMLSGKHPDLVSDEQSSARQSSEAVAISAMVPHQLQQDAMARKVGSMSLGSKDEILRDIEGQGSSTVSGNNFSTGTKAEENDPQKDFGKNKLSESRPFPVQNVEFSRMVGSLKPDASEEVIVSACLKIIALFSQRPEQKHVYMSQHGFLPLIELLDVPNNRVVCSLLQIINHIIKDNIDFLENACLVGLIPIVMNFAVPENPREIRIQAAFFLQQLCLSSTLTLQMFVACGGIPVLVGFLEADYAKFREIVHFAIDGIWQLFKLQQSTPRKDFCCIAAKNNILPKLVTTLYNLNEATCLASLTSGGTFITRNDSASRPSVPLDAPTPATMHMDTPVSLSDQMQKPACHSQRTEATQTLSKKFIADGDEQHPDYAILEAFTSSKFPEVGVENIGNAMNRIGPKEHEYPLKHEHSQSDGDLPRHQISKNFGSRNLIDRPLNHTEVNSNAHSNGINLLASHREQTRSLLSLLEKEKPSRPVSGQLEHVHHISGLDTHENIIPVLHASNDRKELCSLMPVFAASTSGVVSQTMPDILSGSDVLIARTGSTISSEWFSQMESSISADVTREYLERVADLLLEFAQADTITRSYMCNQGLLARVFQMLDKLELQILLKILKGINHLSNDPICLESLQRADAIKHLIPNLELHGGPPVFQIHSEVLNALFNLCKISKKRQDQAAENGIIPQLMKFIMSDSPLKQYALPLLCDMAHASRKSRDQLTAHGGLDVYLDLLEDETWAGTALDSLAVCLAHDCVHRKVEQVLLKKEAIQKLVEFFRNCPEQYFVSILEPLLKIITKSSRINTAMATNGFTTLLIARLDNQDAIARLNLLKLIKAVYECHPKPKQLIVENDLPQKLQKLIEERRDGQRSGQVLVKQMATALLKALHINTVL